MIRAAVLLLLSFLTVVSYAAEDVSQTTIAWPRDLGYRIGDRFEITASTDLAAGYSLDKNSLPKPGRIDRWLELTAVDVTTPSATSLRVTFRYLITGNPDNLTGLIVPPMHYLLTSGEKTWPVVVEAFGYSLAPILLHEQRVAGQMPNLVPASAPPMADISVAKRYAWMGAAAMAITALWLVWANWLRGAVPSWRQPFAVAARKLRALGGEAHYRQALKTVHGAFNATDGRTVLSTDLDVFFTRHPHLKTEEAQIRRFYDHSNSVFYEGESTSRLKLREDLIALCRRCHALRVPRA